MNISEFLICVALFFFCLYIEPKGVNTCETRFHSLWKKLGISFVLCSKRAWRQNSHGVKKEKNAI